MSGLLRGGGALLALALARRGAPGDALGQVPMPSNLDVSKFAEAIARAEGWYAAGPTIPKRANNPGNLKAGDHGGGTINGITIFATPADGWTALRRQLLLIFEGRSSFYTATMTLACSSRTRFTPTVTPPSA